MTVSASSSSFNCSEAVAYTFKQVCEASNVKSSFAKKILSKLQKTADRVAKGALQHSCSIDDQSAYYRKSVNNLPFPVFRNHLGENYAIIKMVKNSTERKKYMYVSSHGWREPFERGYWKRLYVAIKLDFTKRRISKLMNSPVYMWGRTRIDEGRILPDEEMYFRAEPDYYRRMSGYHSVLYYGHCNYAFSKEGDQNSERIGILMEFCPRKLPELRSYALSFEEMYGLIESLLQCLVALEQRNVQHHDIKIENILRDLAGNLKLTDYNLSNDLENKPQFIKACGTSLYILPEECAAVKKLQECPIERDEAQYQELSKSLGQQVFSSKGDVYTMGLLIFELCFGSHPYPRNYFLDLVAKPDDVQSWIYEELAIRERHRVKYRMFVPLIRGMVDFDPTKRYSPAVCLSMMQTIKTVMETEQKQKA